MVTRLGLAMAVSASAMACAAVAQGSGPMLGFTSADADAQRALEARFDAGLSAAAIGERMKQMAAEANQVGSPHDKANAEFTLDEFKAWGWDAHIEVFSVLYPTPRTELLELTRSEPFTATLTEPPIPGDATSARTEGVLPAYVAYGGEGDVTAPLVYANYGMPEDYAALQRLGVDVKGKIVITRYGGGWRGLKPKLAYEHGAVGCIIYSDPADDGYGPGDPYPKGAFRPERGLQRGSVMDMPVEAGDPLTPGIGATADAPRIPRDQARTILKIPTIPISWGDAQHFLAALGGPVGPKSFRGALAVTYHVGGAGAEAHLVVQSNWDQKPLYDVVATIKGSQWPDQWVVRGNHRDGWVYGAQDPLSGQTALMEEAKSIGGLLKTGWRPKRTLIYTSWDGEEAGLLGSTEWAEAHAKDLRSKALLYINSDGNDRGLLRADASYSLQAFINQVGADVRDPETGANTRDRAAAALQVDALATGAKDEAKARAKKVAATGELPVMDLGSGSDYSPFVQHLGIASMNIAYSGEGESGGVYHSAYDTWEHFERFGDPGFAYGVVLAQTVGRLALRAADAEVAPMRFGAFAETVGGEVEDLKKLLTSEREHAQTLDRLLAQKAFALAADPTQPSAPPDREIDVPNLDFAPLDGALSRLKASASAYDRAAATGASAAPDKLLKVDTIIQGAEQAMTDERGLPGRPWYKHLIYAPGLLTGYGAKTLPGVREAIEGRRWDEASDYIGRTAQALDALSTKLDEATRVLAAS